MRSDWRTSAPIDPSTVSLCSSHRPGLRLRTTLPAGKRLSSIPHRRNSRPSKIGSLGGRCAGTAMLPGGAPFKMRAATSAVLRLRSSMDISLPPTIPWPSIGLIGPNNGAFAVA